ncbi:MAG: MarR family transcriptional regulator [Armatimonas sp.]
MDEMSEDSGVVRQKAGLSLSDVAVLRVIAEAEPCRVRHIENTLQIGGGVARVLVDRLEAAGHCIRRRHPGDQRLVSLTESGRVALALATGNTDAPSFGNPG